MCLLDLRTCHVRIRMPTHPRVVVQRRQRGDHGQQDDHGPHGVPAGERRPLSQVAPTVQTRVQAERAECRPLAVLKPKAERT